MKFLQITAVLMTLIFSFSGGIAHAKADTAALYIEAVMTGISTPEESMAAAQEEADAILSQYR